MVDVCVHLQLIWILISFENVNYWKSDYHESKEGIQDGQLPSNAEVHGGWKSLRRNSFFNQTSFARYKDFCIPKHVEIIVSFDIWQQYSMTGFDIEYMKRQLGLQEKDDFNQFSD